MIGKINFLEHRGTTNSSAILKIDLFTHLTKDPNKDPLWLEYKDLVCTQCQTYLLH